MARILFLPVLALSCISFCHAQGSDSIPVTQLHRMLKLAKADTAHVSVLLKLADRHFSQSNRIAKPKALDSALYYTKKAEKLSGDLGYETGTGLGYIMLSKITKRRIPAERITDSRAEFEQSEALALKAVELFTRLGDRPHLADAYMALVTARIFLREAPDIVTTAQQAAELYRQEHDFKNQALALMSAAEYTAKAGKFKQGLDMFNEALNVLEMIGYEKTQGIYA